MPELPDAPVVLNGNIFGIEFTNQFNEDRNAPRVPDGFAKVSVISGAGVAVVKIKTEDLQRLGVTLGNTVVWFVKNSPWKMDSGRNGMSSAFIRPVSIQDLEDLHHAIDASAPVPAGK
jgi:hypothetical protein